MITFKDIYDYFVEVPMAIDRVTPCDRVTP